MLFGFHGFDTLAAIPSNEEAYKTAVCFSAGLQTFAALVGPSGWGKTHLLEAVARNLRTEVGIGDCEVKNASDWIADNGKSDPRLPLILDNVQDLLSKSRSRVQLRLALERRTKGGRPTLLSFTSAKPSRAIKNLLPQQREWAISTIGSPAASERMVVVAKIAETEGVTVSEELIRLLSAKLKGNGLTIRGAMKRLKLHEGNWLGPEGTLRACGVLNPFFSDNSSWDLREHIMDTARAYPMDCAGVAAQDLAIYVMLHKALLAESDVARFFDIEPSKVYNVAGQFEKQVRSCEERTTFVGSFIQQTVIKLHGE